MTSPHAAGPAPRQGAAHPAGPIHGGAGPAGPQTSVTYAAQVATIRRDSDGLMATCWGLRNLDTGEPVRSGEPGPWTKVDGRGVTWRHIGRNVADEPACLLFDDPAGLDMVTKWVRARGPACLKIGRHTYTFGGPAARPYRRPPSVPRYYLHTVARWDEPKPYLIVDRDPPHPTVGAFADRDEADKRLALLNGDQEAVEARKS